MPFLLLFVGLPLVELLVLIEVGGSIGGWSTVGLCLLTAIVGGSMARRQGTDVLMRMRASVHRGILPAGEMVDSVLIVVSGLLLMTPGFITDAIGLLLLIAPLRAAFRPIVMRRFVGQGPMRGNGYGAYGSYTTGHAHTEKREERSGRTSYEPEFLPPGTVKQPPRPDEPPEIVVD